MAAGKGVAHLHFDLLEKLALETPTLNQGKGFRVEGLGKFTKFGECVECRVWELRGTYFHSLGLAYCTLVSVASMFHYCLLFVQQQTPLASRRILGHSLLGLYKNGNRLEGPSS